MRADNEGTSLRDRCLMALFVALKRKWSNLRREPTGVLLRNTGMTKRKLCTLVLAAGIASISVAWLSAQTVKRFDVVSIKPDKDGHGLDAGTQPGGRYSARNVPAEFVVTEAFGVKAFQ